MTDEDAGDYVRPAGVLYGKSLLDVLSDRKKHLKSRQRSYNPGNDGTKPLLPTTNPSRIQYEKDLTRLRDAENEEVKEREKVIAFEALSKEKIRIKEAKRKSQNKLTKQKAKTLRGHADEDDGFDGEDVTAKFGQIELDGRKVSIF